MVPGEILGRGSCEVFLTGCAVLHASRFPFTRMGVSRLETHPALDRSSKGNSSSMSVIRTKQEKTEDRLFFAFDVYTALVATAVLVMGLATLLHT